MPELFNGQYTLALKTRITDIADITRLQNEGYVQSVATVIAGRAPGASRTHIEARLSQLTPPDRLPDIAQAIERLRRAILDSETIGLVSDHDVDGVTSHALMKEMLISYGVDPHKIRSYIGHRLKEGYGLSEGVARRIIDDPAPPQLVITADCGSSDEVRIANLKQHGIDVIVTDHHEIPAEGIPASAFACISPSRADSEYNDRLIAGCMVAWLLMVALGRRLVAEARLDGSSIDVRNCLDFVALGTVADCVSLAKSVNNRAVVRAGLALIQQHRRPCWRAAAQYIGESPTLSANVLAFGIGPRINARGRLDEAMAGVHFLLSDSDTEATELALLLETENEARKSIESRLVAEATGIAENSVKNGNRGLVIWLENGHSGVHGIVASRLVERFGCPTICLSPHATQPHQVTGSARSICGFHMRDALQEISAHEPRILQRFGGHAGAAGLSINARDRQQFTELFQSFCNDRLTDADVAPACYFDGSLDPVLIDDDLIDEFEALEPFGREFDTPLFISEFTVVRSRPVGRDQTHLSMSLSAGHRQYDAIWFSALSGDYPMPLPGEIITLAYTPQRDWFRGAARIKLMVKGVVY